jgi:hypothetical protein
LSAERRQAKVPRRARDRPGFGVRHRHRPFDVEAGDGGNGLNGGTNGYSLELQSTPQLQKDEANPVELDDDSIDLYLQVKDTVNYFSTDQTQKGAPSSSRTTTVDANAGKSHVYWSPLAAQTTERGAGIPKQKHDATKTLAMVDALQ